MTQQEELKVLFPESNVTLSTGETIEIKPFTFGQLPKAISKAAGLVTLFQQARSNQDSEQPEQNTQQLIISAMASGGEELLQLVAFGINKPREWFDTLGADDGVLITSQFVSVNMDFFIQKVLPQFQAGMQKLKKSPTSSASSSAADSPTAT